MTSMTLEGQSVLASTTCETEHPPPRRRNGPVVAGRNGSEAMATRFVGPTVSLCQNAGLLFDACQGFRSPPLAAPVRDWGPAAPRHPQRTGNQMPFDHPRGVGSAKSAHSSHRSTVTYIPSWAEGPAVKHVRKHSATHVQDKCRDNGRTVKSHLHMLSISSAANLGQHKFNFAHFT